MNVGPKLGSAFNCTSCHNGWDRGVLNSALHEGPTVSLSITYKLIHEWSMPPARNNQVAALIERVRALDGLSDVDALRFRNEGPSERSEKLLAGANYMARLGALSPEDLQTLETYLAEKMRENRRIQEQIFPQYQRAVRDWLRQNHP